MEDFLRRRVPNDEDWEFRSKMQKLFHRIINNRDFYYELREEFYPQCNLTYLINQLWSLEDFHEIFDDEPIQNKKEEAKAQRENQRGIKAYTEKESGIALKCFTLSIIYEKSQPHGSNGTLGLLYRSRSRVLFDIGEYEKCIMDIQRARDYGVPHDDLTQLFERETKCKKAIRLLSQGKPYPPIPKPGSLEGAEAEVEEEPVEESKEKEFVQFQDTAAEEIILEETEDTLEGAQETRMPSPHRSRRVVRRISRGSLVGETPQGTPQITRRGMPRRSQTPRGSREVSPQGTPQGLRREMSRGSQEEIPQGARGTRRRSQTPRGSKGETPHGSRGGTPHSSQGESPPLVLEECCRQQSGARMKRFSKQFDPTKKFMHLCYQEKIPIPEFTKGLRKVPCLSRSLAIKTTSEDNLRCIFAIANIHPGEILIQEDCFSYETEEPFMRNHCTYCLLRTVTPIPCDKCTTAVFCNESCRDAAYESFHLKECSFLQSLIEMEVDGVVSSVRGLFQVPYKQLFEQFDKFDAELSCKNVYSYGFNEQKVFNSLDIRAIYTLPSYLHKRDFEELIFKTIIGLIILKLLCWDGKYIGKKIQLDKDTRLPLDMTKLASLIVHLILINTANTHDNIEFKIVTKNIEETPQIIGHNMSPLIALLRHSCDPNSRVFNYGTVSVCKAINFIPSGTVITVCHGLPFYVYGDTVARRRYHKVLNYLCTCAACEEKWPPMNKLYDKVAIICPECKHQLDREKGCSKCSTNEFIFPKYFINPKKKKLPQIPPTKEKKVSFKETQIRSKGLIKMPSPESSERPVEPIVVASGSSEDAEVVSVDTSESSLKSSDGSAGPSGVTSEQSDLQTSALESSKMSSMSWDDSNLSEHIEIAGSPFILEEIDSKVDIKKQINRAVEALKSIEEESLPLFHPVHHLPPELERSESEDLSLIRMYENVEDSIAHQYASEICNYCTNLITRVSFNVPPPPPIPEQGEDTTSTQLTSFPSGAALPESEAAIQSLRTKKKKYIKEQLDSSNRGSPTNFKDLDATSQSNRESTFCGRFCPNVCSQNRDDGLCSMICFTSNGERHCLHCCKSSSSESFTTRATQSNPLSSSSTQVSSQIPSIADFSNLPSQPQSVVTTQPSESIRTLIQAQEIDQSLSENKDRDSTAQEKEIVVIREKLKSFWKKQSSKSLKKKKSDAESFKSDENAFLNLHTVVNVTAREQMAESSIRSTSVSWLSDDIEKEIDSWIEQFRYTGRTRSNLSDSYVETTHILREVDPSNRRPPQTQSAMSYPQTQLAGKPSANIQARKACELSREFSSSAKQPTASKPAQETRAPKKSEFVRESTDSVQSNSYANVSRQIPSNTSSTNFTIQSQNVVTTQPQSSAITSIQAQTPILPRKEQHLPVNLQTIHDRNADLWDNRSRSQSIIETSLILSGVEPDDGFYSMLSSSAVKNLEGYKSSHPPGPSYPKDDRSLPTSVPNRPCDQPAKTKPIKHSSLPSSSLPRRTLQPDPPSETYAERDLSLPPPVDPRPHQPSETYAERDLSLPPPVDPRPRPHQPSETYAERDLSLPPPADPRPRPDPSQLNYLEDDLAAGRPDRRRRPVNVDPDETYIEMSTVGYNQPNISVGQASKLSLESSSFAQQYEASKSLAAVISGATYKPQLESSDPTTPESPESTSESTDPKASLPLDYPGGGAKRKVSSNYKRTLRKIQIVNSKELHELVEKILKDFRESGSKFYNEETIHSKDVEMVELALSAIGQFIATPSLTYVSALLTLNKFYALSSYHYHDWLEQDSKRAKSMKEKKEKHSGKKRSDKKD